MSKKTVEKNDPWAPAQPYILQNLQDTKNTYDLNQPKLQNFASMQQDTYGRFAPGSESGIHAAQSLVNRNLSGANLTGNPYLEGIIGKTRRNVTDQANSQFTAAGRYGSGAHSATLGRELADAENGLRYRDYGAERAIQQNSIGDAQNLMGGATGLLNNAAQLPWVGVQAQNGGTNSLTNGYGVTTSKTSGLGNVIDGIGAAGKAMSSVAQGVGSVGAMFASDERVKNIGPKVGTDRATGFSLYDYTYKNDPAQTPQTGVMAQEVEQSRPDAVATMPNGVKAVDYSALGLPGPGDMAGMRQDIAPIKRPRMGIISTLKDDPTLSKPENTSLAFWSRLAKSGNIGDAVLGSGVQARADDKQEHDWGAAASEAAALAQHRAALESRLARSGQRPRIMQQRDGSIVSVDPDTLEQTQISGPVQGPERMLPTENGYQPASKAVGLNPYARPPAGRGGGGVPGASAARYRADAAAAIARGADPAKVNARLAQIMGGQ